MAPAPYSGLRAFVEERYDGEVVLKPLEELLERLEGGGESEDDAG